MESLANKMLKLFNTLTKKIEDFKPIKDKNVGIYTCGPTVYDFAHIGNFRAYISADVLKRYLVYRGYNVKHVMNITDVDDKTIKGSHKNKISLREYTENYTKIFFEDIKTLNISTPDFFPRAAEHIPEMIDIIKKLLNKGIAYKSSDNSVYFAISKFKDYGKLSHIQLENLKEGARVKHDEYSKDEAKDFCLWKAYDKDDNDVFWDTELGKGRPGWHIECSAMNMKYLGEEFDIHTGGVDLIFPHHENEIAQSCGATGKSFVHFWIHNEHLLVNGRKMSKSLGNFYTLRDLLDKNHNPRAIRYLLLSTHYRQQLNFTEDALDGAQNTMQRFDDLVLKLKEIKELKELKKNSDENKRVSELIAESRKVFEKNMDNDLSISEALAGIFEFTREINIILNEDGLSKSDSEKVIGFLKEIDNVLGVMKFEDGKIEKDIEDLIAERDNARKSKDFKRADEIRAELLKKGIILEDTSHGTRWKKS